MKNQITLSTNMVYSFFCAYSFLKKEKDVMMCYSDIVFDKNLFNISLKKSSFIFAKKDWLQLGKKNEYFYIKRDAEDFVTKKNKLISIGGKINKKKFPKLQFMGLTEN